MTLQNVLDQFDRKNPSHPLLHLYDFIDDCIFSYYSSPHIYVFVDDKRLRQKHTQNHHCECAHQCSLCDCKKRKVNIIICNNNWIELNRQFKGVNKLENLLTNQISTSIHRKTIILQWDFFLLFTNNHHRNNITEGELERWRKSRREKQWQKITLQVYQPIHNSKRTSFQLYSSFVCVVLCVTKIYVRVNLCVHHIFLDFILNNFEKWPNYRYALIQNPTAYLCV